MDWQFDRAHIVCRCISKGSNEELRGSVCFRAGFGRHVSANSFGDLVNVLEVIMGPYVNGICGCIYV